MARLRFFLNVFAIVGLSFALSACTRGKPESASVKLTIPALNSSKVGSQSSSSDLIVVIINVTAPDLTQPVVFQWDAHNCGSDLCTPPSSYSLDVPMGRDRLVQVLAVFEDESKMEFKYGDNSSSLATFSRANETVTITVAPAGSSNMQGHIYGRYLNADGTGPTGVLVAKFAPPGKPAMSIMSSYMFSGWFTNLMAMDGNARFSYYLNGQPLFSDVHLASPLIAGSNEVLRVKIPAREREHGESEWELESEERMILGFFGPGASGKKTCYDSRSGIPIDGIRLPGGSDDVSWGGSSPGANDAGREAGGVGYNPESEACGDPNDEYVSYLTFRQDEIRNGRDGLGGFQGPFRGLEGDYGMQFVQTEYDQATQKLQLFWKFLPGVTSGSQRVAGVTVYRRAGTDDEGVWGMDGIDCGRLPSVGFTNAGEMLTTSGQVDAELEISGVSSPSNMLLILCPFLNGNSGRVYPTGGGVDVRLHEHSGFNATLGLKFIGTAIYDSIVDTVPISQPATVLKMQATSEFQSLAVSVGHYTVTASQIQSVEASVNSGAWFPIHFEDESYFGRNVVAIPISSYNTPTGRADLYNAISSASTDDTLKIRVKLTSEGKNSLGVPKATYESPEITLIGSATCPSPGSLELLDLDSLTVANPTDLLNSVFNVTGGSDITKTYRLRFSGCPQASAPVDFFQISGSTNPMGCFGHEDLLLGYDPFSFQIAPTDKFGVDCEVGGYSIQVATPSNAGSYNVTISGSSATIQHSTTPSKLGFIASIYDTSGLTVERFLLKLAMLGPNTPFAALAVQMNSDDRLTLSSGVASTATTWLLNAMSAAWNFVSSPARLFNFSTTSTIPALNVDEITAIDGGISGSLPVLPVSFDKTVIAVSKEEVNGGTPLLLLDTGSGLQLAHLTSTSGNYLGKSIKYISMPTDITLASNPDFVKMILRHDANGVWVWIGLRYGTTSKFLYGDIVSSGGSIDVAWASSSTQTGKAFSGADYVDDMGTTMIMVVTEESSLIYLRSLSLPGAFNVINSTALSDMTSVIDMTHCEQELWVVGRNGSDLFSAKRLTGYSDPTVQNFSTSHAVGPYTQVSCLGAKSSDIYSSRFFALYSHNSTSTALVSIEGLGGYCGESMDTELSGDQSLGGAVTTPPRQIMAAKHDGYEGFLVLQQAVAPNEGKTEMAFVPVTCDLGLVSVGSQVTWGSLAAPASSIRGMTSLQLGPNQHHVNSLAIFGAKHQFYKLQAR